LTAYERGLTLERGPAVLYHIVHCVVHGSALSWGPNITLTPSLLWWHCYGFEHITGCCIWHMQVFIRDCLSRHATNVQPMIYSLPWQSAPSTT